MSAKLNSTEKLVVDQLIDQGEIFLSEEDAQEVDVGLVETKVKNQYGVTVLVFWYEAPKGLSLRLPYHLR